MKNSLFQRIINIPPSPVLMKKKPKKVFLDLSSNHKYSDFQSCFYRNSSGNQKKKMRVQFHYILSVILMSCIVLAHPTITAVPRHPLSKRDIAGFYNSVSLDVTSFYADFVSNRYSYLNNYKSFFLTHTWENVNDKFSSVITYTDNSFTTVVQQNSELSSQLATIAKQFPWYSDWVKANQASGSSASASPTANSAVRSNSNISLGSNKGQLGLISMAVGFLTLTICVTMV